MEYFSDVESYVQGELTGQKLTDFEAAMVSDPLLQEAVLEHRDMVRRLQGVRLRNAIKKKYDITHTPSSQVGRYACVDPVDR
jgi:hypothetical protein